MVLVAALTFIPSLSAHGSTKDDLDAARGRLATARDEANAAAAEFSAADHQLQETQDNIAGHAAAIEIARAKAAQLHGIAAERALYAYKHAGNRLDVVFGAQDAVQAVRRTQLLDRANQTDSDVVRKLAAINQDLRDEEAQLQKERQQQQQVSDRLDARKRELEAKQADVQKAVNNLQVQLDAEIAAAEAARRAELERERQALLAQQISTAGGPGIIIVNPGGGPFQCPVSGPAYSDDYGGPRGHPGNDLFVPTGTPAVAVKAGTVRYVPNEGAGGNTAYLSASDGNTYFYAHLSQFVGGARSVSQGEVIGLTGMTGNATAPHLHFEIRLGGVNGNRIDPYPTLKSSKC